MPLIFISWVSEIRQADPAKKCDRNFPPFAVRKSQSRSPALQYALPVICCRLARQVRKWRGSYFGIDGFHAVCLVATTQQIFTTK